MKLAIHSKSEGVDAQESVLDLIRSAKALGVELAISQEFACILSDKSFHICDLDTFNRHKDLSSFDFLFSLGGDGTILDAITFSKASETPIVGINLG